VASVISEDVTNPVASPLCLPISIMVCTGVLPSAAILTEPFVIRRPVAICPAAAADSATMASAVSFTRYGRVSRVHDLNHPEILSQHASAVKNHAAPKWLGPIPSPMNRMTFLALPADVSIAPWLAQPDSIGESSRRRPAASASPKMASTCHRILFCFCA